MHTCFQKGMEVPTILLRTIEICGETACGNEVSRSCCFLVFSPLILPATTFKSSESISGSSVLVIPNNQDNRPDEINEFWYIRTTVSSPVLPNSSASYNSEYLSSPSHLPNIDMPQSPLLGSFDPFATHPFTNGSGLVPEAPQPSEYLMPMPSRSAKPAYYASSSYSYTASPASSGASTPASTHASTPMYSPRPLQQAPAGKPIFVPFQRSDTSSPDLVLKKKVPYLAGK